MAGLLCILSGRKSMKKGFYHWAHVQQWVVCTLYAAQCARREPWVGEPRLMEWRGKKVWTLFSGQQGATEGSEIIIVMHRVKLTSQ